MSMGVCQACPLTFSKQAAAPLVRIDKCTNVPRDFKILVSGAWRLLGVRPSPSHVLGDVRWLSDPTSPVDKKIYFTEVFLLELADNKTLSGFPSVCLSRSENNQTLYASLKSEGVSG